VFTLAMHIARLGSEAKLAGLGMTVILFHNFLGFMVLGTNVGYNSVAGRAFGSGSRLVF
jgi:hypothetical protein